MNVEQITWICITWSPGFSRLNACLRSGILTGKPDPVEAGTPERRDLD
ncbi:MAG: hypothetical protein ACLFVO_24170 [Chloroflexaceae bacterium]